jgi:hypothetical protein
VFLLPIFHRLNTNPNYIIIMASFTGLAANLIRAFTTQASIFIYIIFLPTSTGLLLLAKSKIKEVISSNMKDANYTILSQLYEKGT